VVKPGISRIVVLGRDGFGAAVDVHDEEAFGVERFPHPLKIVPEGFALLEDAEGKIERKG